MKILLNIKLLFLTLFLYSCETVSDWTENIMPSGDIEESDNETDQLLSDDFGKDPTLAEILADAEFEDELFQDSEIEVSQNYDQTDSTESLEMGDSSGMNEPSPNIDSQDEIEELETAEEKLTPAPAIEYETSLLSDDDVIVENNELAADVNEAKEQKNEESFEANIFSRPVLDLKDQIQFRIATITFSTGSSQVDYIGQKKIKKIAKIAKERDAKIKIIGHASERTKDMPIAKHKIVNFIISDKRANSVAEIFINKYKFPSEKLITQGVSDSKPLFKEIMPAGTKANQRTEIFLIYN